MIIEQPSESEMRSAVAARDAAFDGRFVYAVVTTGVYCRPSCAARPARPENLRFHPTPEAAARAGFRPCRRCRPDQADAAARAAVEAARFIESHRGDRLTLATLAKRTGCSPSHLQRTFKAAFGVTPKAYQDAVRLRDFKSSLKQGDDVAGAIFGAGYGSTSRVYGEASRNLGMTPSSYRAGGAGEEIHFAARDTPLGTLMLAATGRGICFAQFGDDVDALRTRLAEEFPKATYIASPTTRSPELAAWIEALVDYLREGGLRPELPLDLRGTAFQLRVWRFLLGIPDGEVVSYREVAEGIERPTAIRAVARACAANRVAVLVPCHRVLRGDGALSGYRWGVDRKRALLDAERRRRG